MTKHGAASDQISEVMFYTRPGCPYCTSLRWRLRRSGLPFREVDIWANPSAAALVRTLTGGSQSGPGLGPGDGRGTCAASREDSCRYPKFARGVSFAGAPDHGAYGVEVRSRRRSPLTRLRWRSPN